MFWVFVSIGNNIGKHPTIICKYTHPRMMEKEVSEKQNKVCLGYTASKLQKRIQTPFKLCPFHYITLGVTGTY